MKKLAISFSAIVFAFTAIAALFSQTKQIAIGGGSTNSVVFDISQGSAMSLTVNYSGIPWHKTSSTIGIITNPVATAAEALSVVLSGTTNVYTWTNSKVVLPASTAASSLTNLFYRIRSEIGLSPSISGTTLTLSTNTASMSAFSSGGWATSAVTNVVSFGITNNPTSSNAQTLAIFLAGNRTNVYTITNANAAYSQIAAGATIVDTRDSILNRIAIDYPTIRYSATDSLITFYGAASFSVTNSDDGWASNSISTTATVTVTNNPSATAAQTLSLVTSGTTNAYTWTNALHVLPGSASAASMTNLFRRLTADYTTLVASQTAAAVIQLITPADEAFATFQTGTYSTNLLTTNALVGNISLVAYKGNDGSLWVADSSYNISLPATNGPTTFSTNMTSLPAYGLMRWDIYNYSTNAISIETMNMVSGLR